jgi:hypothetical protein
MVTVFCSSYFYVCGSNEDKEEKGEKGDFSPNQLKWNFPSEEVGFDKTRLGIRQTS